MWRNWNLLLAGGKVKWRSSPQEFGSASTSEAWWSSDPGLRLRYRPERPKTGVKMKVHRTVGSKGWKQPNVISWWRNKMQQIHRVYKDATTKRNQELIHAYNRDESCKQYTKWKKPEKKATYFKIPFIYVSRTGKFTGTESKLVAARGWGSERMGSNCLMHMHFLPRWWKSSGTRQVWQLHNTANVLTDAALCTLKWQIRCYVFC